MESGNERKYDTFQSSQDSHLSFFPEQSNRKHLKWSITGVCIFGCVVIVFNIILASATYGYVNHSDPILISPYTNISTNATYLQPCIFTRLNASYSASDQACSTGGYCPYEWECNSVPVDGQPARVCTNNNFECPNDNQCYEFISDLPQYLVNGMAIVESDVGVNTGNFVASIVISLILLICFVILLMIYEAWCIIAGDPFSDTYGTKGRAHSGLAGSLADKYERFFDDYLQSSPKKCYFIIAVILIPFFILSFASLVVFVLGISPSIPTIAEDTECVNNHDFYIITSSLVGWSVIFSAAYLLALIMLWILFAMYLIGSVFKYWKSHIFFFACILLAVVFVLALAVELFGQIF